MSRRKKINTQYIMNANAKVPDLAKIIDQFKSIKPISGDKLEDIKKQHPKLNPFAEVELKEKLPIYENFYLALVEDLSNETYSKIVLLGERKNLRGKVIYDILFTIYEFEQPIPSNPKIEITSPASSADQNEFNKQVPPIGVKYNLIGVIKVGNVKIFIATAKAVYPNAPAYIYIYM